MLRLIIGGLVGMAAISSAFAQQATVSSLLQQGYEVVSATANPGGEVPVALKKGASLYICIAQAPNGMMNDPVIKTLGCRPVQ